MFLKYDVITTSIIVALIAIGTVAIYSATYAADIDTGNFFVKQLIWAVTGLSFMFFISLIPIRLINRFAYWIYGISIFLLIMVLFFGRIGQGAERWLVIGPVHIHPSELSKLATVLAVSKYLSDKYADVNQVRYFGISVLLILVPFLLIARQPDLGTALVFLALVIPLLFWAGLNWFAIFTILTPVLTMILSFNFWAFLFLMISISLVLVFSRKKPAILVAVFLLNIVVGIVTPYLWNQLRPYQQKRILTFVNPEQDPKGAGYQIIQSQVAIGSGGVWGKGYMNGSQTHLRFLPAQHTDFIFSVIGEEFGFAGITVVLLLFLILILRLIHIASLIREQFESMTVIGITTIIAFHTLINVGMTIGMAPVTGLPLPFLSYGGSALIANLLMMGIVLNISRNKINR
jgi:rod shape determining protein RodA